MIVVLFFFSSRRRHTRSLCDWSSDVCSSDLPEAIFVISSLALLKDHSCHLPRTGWRRKMRSGFSFSHFKKESRIGFLVIGFLDFRYSDEINEKKCERPQLLHF